MTLNTLPQCSRITTVGGAQTQGRKQVRSGTPFRIQCKALLKPPQLTRAVNPRAHTAVNHENTGH